MPKTKEIIKNKKHWRTFFDRDYIGGFSLTDMDAVVTITKHIQENVKNHKNNTEKVKFVLYVKDKEKEQKMILNATNGAAIERALGTPDPEQWVGKQIQLFTERGTWFGKESDALRVRDIAPKQKEKVDVTSDLKKLKACKTLEELPVLYKSLKHWANPEVVALKDELKTLLK